MLSSPIAWAKGHHDAQNQPVKITITQPVKHVSKKHIAKKHIAKKYAAKKHIAKKYATHRTIRNKPANHQQHQSHNRSHTGQVISNVAGLLLVIK